MPMTEDAQFGKNADNTKNTDYCCYCYPNGAFSSEETMEEMIESCLPFCVESGFPSEEAARAEMLKVFPALKRWSK